MVDRALRILRNLLPIGNILGMENWKFQQDNTSIYGSHAIKNRFARNQANVRDWPVISLDLNLMKNVLGVLARDVSMVVNFKVFKN